MVLIYPDIARFQENLCDLQFRSVFVNIIRRGPKRRGIYTFAIGRRLQLPLHIQNNVLYQYIASVIATG